MHTTDDRYWELARTLLDGLRDQDRLDGCAHAGSAAVLHACAGHPVAGLACPTCAASHLQRHHMDLGCLLCGAAGATSAMYRTWPVMTVLLTARGGAELPWTGAVEGLLGHTCAATAQATVPGRVRTTAAAPRCTTSAGGPLPPGP